MKKVFAMLTVLVLAFAMSTEVLAASPKTVHPMWTNVNSVSPTIYASTGEYASEIYAVVGTTKIECTLTLYEESSPGSDNFVYKSSISDVHYGRQHVFRGYTTIKSGVRYKLVTSATVTCNGYAEPISVTWIKQC